MMRLKRGDYHTDIRLYNKLDRCILVTKVHYYPGRSQTRFEPEEEAELEVLDAEWEDTGETIGDHEEVITDKLFDDLWDEFNREMDR
jgi:hypothetical protein